MNFIGNSYLFTVVAAGAWDLGTTSYASKSLSVASQETTPRGLFFSSDGSKAYVVGTQNNTVYQYTLSTPWDVSTGSYASKSMSVAGETTSPRGLAFKSDGTAAYTIASTGDVVYQYTLSTPWDVSTGSYASKSFNSSAQVIGAEDLKFSADGSKMYCFANPGSDSTIYQYTLSTPWDVSTASYASKSFNAYTEAGATATDLFFKDDGAVLFIVSGTNDAVYQYTVSTPWDISTAVSAGKSMSVGSQETAANGVSFSSDGTKAYIVGSTNDTIYQYNIGS